MDTPDLIQKAADYAAFQSDRWLFVATLIITGIAVGWLARYFIKALQSEREQTTAAYTEFNTYLKTANAELTSVIKSYTDALNSNTKVIEKLHDNFDKK